MNKQIKSRERVSNYGEVFTAPREVNAMLDLVKEECDRIDSRFLEPACGDGNFLVEILRRKLAAANIDSHSQNEYEEFSTKAVESIYGVDIQPDNVAAARERLFELYTESYAWHCGVIARPDIRFKIRDILNRNIVCGDFLTKTTSDGEPIWFLE